MVMPLMIISEPMKICADLLIVQIEQHSNAACLRWKDVAKTNKSG
jgi:hypothetical protein